MISIYSSSIADLHDRCSLINKTKDTVLAMTSIWAQPTSCHHLQPAFYSHNRNVLAKNISLKIFLILNRVRAKPLIPATPTREYFLGLIFRATKRGVQNWKKTRLRYPKGDSTTQEVLKAQLKWLQTLFRPHTPLKSHFEVGEENHHCFCHGFGVPRCIAFCAHHRTLGFLKRPRGIYPYEKTGGRNAGLLTPT